MRRRRRRRHPSRQWEGVLVNSLHADGLGEPTTYDYLCISDTDFAII